MLLTPVGSASRSGIDTKGAVMAKEQKVTTVRLRNSKSGAVVNVSEETAARLGSEWGPADAKAPAKKSTAKKS